MRWVAALAVVLGSAVAGALKASELAERPRQLRTLQRDIQMLITEIGYFATPIPLALQAVGRSSHGPVALLWQRVCQRLQDSREQSFSKVWYQCVREVRPHLSLSGEDWVEIQSLGGWLGRSEGTDQVAKLKGLNLRLQRLEEQALVRRDQLARLYRYLGWAVGVGICIFLM